MKMLLIQRKWLSIVRSRWLQNFSALAARRQDQDKKGRPLWDTEMNIVLIYCVMAWISVALDHSFVWKSIKPKKGQDVQRAERIVRFFAAGNLWNSVASKKYGEDHPFQPLELLWRSLLGLEERIGVKKPYYGKLCSMYQSADEDFFFHMNNVVFSSDRSILIDKTRIFISFRYSVTTAFEVKRPVIY